jgi:hypothetical protein
MIKDFKFNKKRIFLGIFFSLLMLLISIFFVLKSEIFIRNVFMKTIHIQILGTIGIMYFSFLFYSLLRLFPRKYALIVSDEYLIDHSRYESFGKIEWKNISKIQKIKKESIELYLNKSVFQNRKMNLLEIFLVFMHNWNFKKSIIISSALMECSIEELFNEITFAYQNHKKINTNS